MTNSLLTLLHHYHLVVGFCICRGFSQRCRAISALVALDYCAAFPVAPRVPRVEVAARAQSAAFAASASLDSRLSQRIRCMPRKMCKYITAWSQMSWKWKQTFLRTKVEANGNNFWSKFPNSSFTCTHWHAERVVDAWAQVNLDAPATSELRVTKQKQVAKTFWMSLFGVYALGQINNF